MVRQRKNLKAEKQNTDKKDEKKTEKEVKVSNAFGWDALEHAKFKLQVYFLQIYSQHSGQTVKIFIECLILCLAFS